MKYGKELIIDLTFCNPKKFNRKCLKIYFEGICRILDMVPEDQYFWDYVGCSREEYELAPIHLKGTSAIQFITTSNITIHTLDKLKEVYLNIFSCKEFDVGKAVDYSRRFFDGVINNFTVIERG